MKESEEAQGRPRKRAKETVLQENKEIAAKLQSLIDNKEDEEEVNLASLLLPQVKHTPEGATPATAEDANTDEHFQPGAQRSTAVVLDVDEGDTTEKEKVF